VNDWWKAFFDRSPGPDRPPRSDGQTRPQSVAATNHVSGVDHELEQVAVGVAGVHAGRSFPAATLARYWTLDDLGASAIE
jgi:hypothetical protein